MSNSGSEQLDHQRDHGTTMSDRDEGGGTSPEKKREKGKRKEKGHPEEKLCEKRKPDVRSLQKTGKGENREKERPREKEKKEEEE
ncbi:hypothetical protein ACOSQ2_029368 [Xanthoceras sorbifolium]